MKARYLGILMAILVGANTAYAQKGPEAPAPWQFSWEKGQTYVYKSEQVVTVAEVVDGSKSESTSRVNLVKRWQVTDVDAKGVATLKLSLASMRNEQIRPKGEVLLFDSENPDKSTPDLKEQLAKFVGQTLAIVRIDRQGRIHEVKQGSAARFEEEPPFVLMLPTVAPREGQTWMRTYNVTLDPPHGAGEKFAAIQKYSCRKIDGQKATVALTTEIKGMPEGAREQMPLLHKLVEGGMVFNTSTGRLESARLAVDRTMENHQGAGSSYHFTSTFTEQLVEMK